MSVDHARIREIRVSGSQPPPGTEPRWGRLLQGMFLTPAYWLLASALGAPGTGMHLRAAWLGIRLLRAGSRRHARRAFRLVFSPLDSVRYFELATIWRWLPGSMGGRYLDVSSPRLLPLLVVDRRRCANVVMVNPDLRDLAETSEWTDAGTLRRRCFLTACLSEDPPFPPGSFDVITSLSVIEHIPGDTQAVRALWGLLRPGGRLLISVPCAADSMEEYTDIDVYGLLPPSNTGLWFWQRFYDPTGLSQRIFAVTGSPSRMAVYGEKSPGRLAENARRKWTDQDYPYWREAYSMATQFRAYKSIDAMPGQGVVAMEFRKLPA